MSDSTITWLIPAALRMHNHHADSIEVNATDVRSALAALAAERATLAQHIVTRDGQLRPYVNIFVNNRNVRDLDGLDTPVAPGETLLIVPSVAGG